MKQAKLYKIIFFLSLLGIILSGYLTQLHYNKLNSPCDLSETFQCSLVNQSKYAEFLGLPVALYGLVGYLLIGFISYFLFKRKSISNSFLQKLFGLNSLVIISSLALLISLYLTYAEIFLIKALCLFCIISQVNVIAIFILTLLIKKEGSEVE